MPTPTEIDPIFGTLADLDKLTEQLHRRDMKLMMDLVINHSSDEHRWFMESRASRHDAKRENPQVCQALYAMMRGWLDRGVDGFRMDVINLISKYPSLPDGMVAAGHWFGDITPHPPQRRSWAGFPPAWTRVMPPDVANRRRRVRRGEEEIDEAEGGQRG